MLFLNLWLQLLALQDPPRVGLEALFNSVCNETLCLTFTPGVLPIPRNGRESWKGSKPALRMLDVKFMALLRDDPPD
ncbi:hypothetical protein EVAR_35978_1 [Eumeta japonica]|uniref:Secreted protein n=1 Tax=Eumeta variegata TaxID=151549 RepID=A0A4C1WT20_EUMVA|nr:hypothetical protein EVAR_35978_1 [Eumeta japonica]